MLVLKTACFARFCRRYEVVTAVEAPGATSDAVFFSLELLQCQLLSLVGLAPDEQILVSSEWTLVAMPPSLQPAQLTLKRSDLRPRFFLFDATSSDTTADLHDWQSICSKAMFGDIPVVQPAFRNADSLVCQACANTCSACKSGSLMPSHSLPDLMRHIA